MFLAIKHYLNPVGQPELDSESEIIWAKIDLPGLKNVFICSFYKPKGNDHEGAAARRHPVRKFRSGMKAMTAPRQEARPRRKLPRQKYIFPFSKHKEV